MAVAATAALGEGLAAAMARPVQTTAVGLGVLPSTQPARLLVVYKVGGRGMWPEETPQVEGAGICGATISFCEARWSFGLARPCKHSQQRHSTTPFLAGRGAADGAGAGQGGGRGADGRLGAGRPPRARGRRPRGGPGHPVHRRGRAAVARRQGAPDGKGESAGLRDLMCARVCSVCVALCVGGECWCVHMRCVDALYLRASHTMPPSPPLPAAQVSWAKGSSKKSIGGDDTLLPPVPLPECVSKPFTGYAKFAGDAKSGLLGTLGLEVLIRIVPAPGPPASWSMALVESARGGGERARAAGLGASPPPARRRPWPRPLMVEGAPCPKTISSRRAMRPRARSPRRRRPGARPVPGGVRPAVLPRGPGARRARQHVRGLGAGGRAARRWAAAVLLVASTAVSNACLLVSRQSPSHPFCDHLSPQVLPAGRGAARAARVGDPREPGHRPRGAPPYGAAPPPRWSDPYLLRHAQLAAQPSSAPAHAHSLCL
jgi:hypothetical protein